ncbi:hypothetical protein C8R47DRAFT_1169564 [Mycena vitilis]|nr:hypothetical protein C8R47DRAFT_1169564 [Mycena vitilis]
MMPGLQCYPLGSVLRLRLWDIALVPTYKSRTFPRYLTSSSFLAVDFFLTMFSPLLIFAVIATGALATPVRRDQPAPPLPPPPLCPPSDRNGNKLILDIVANAEIGECNYQDAQGACFYHLNDNFQQTEAPIGGFTGHGPSTCPVSVTGEHGCQIANNAGLSLISSGTEDAGAVGCAYGPTLTPFSCVYSNGQLLPDVIEHDCPPTLIPRTAIPTPTAIN